MNIEEAKASFQDGSLEKAEIRLDPGTLTEWFIILVDIQAKRYILADEDDNPLLNNDVQGFFTVLKQIGFRSTEIYF